ncbi:MAG: type IV pilus assembly protein PilM, partial [Gammaproteobacteria bacterium]
MSQLFTRKSPPVLGLDISSTSVKLVELSLQNGRYRVESFAVEPLPPNSVVEKSINDIDAIGEAVQRVVKRAKAKSKHAAVAVAGSSVITKTIPMPANLSETELEDQIELEADQYVPYPLEEVSLDFEVIGQTVNNPDTIDVLLAACRTETVDMRTAAIESGGLSAKIVDIEAYATENAFQLLVDQIP